MRCRRTIVLTVTLAALVGCNHEDGPGSGPVDTRAEAPVSSPTGSTPGDDGPTDAGDPTGSSSPPVTTTPTDQSPDGQPTTGNGATTGAGSPTDDPGATATTPTATTTERSSDGRPTTGNNVQIGASFHGELSFGRTRPGVTVSRALTVGGTPADGSEVRVTDVRVDDVRDDPVFQLTGHTCTGATFPGPACTVTVLATPPADGDFRASLQVSARGVVVARASLIVTGGSGPPIPDGPPVDTSDPPVATAN